MAKNLTLTDKDVKDSMIAQLRAIGADVPHFLILIDQFMFYRKEFRRLQKEVKQGTMIEVVGANGGTYQKENPAIKQAASCTQAMIRLLDKLGLDTDGCAPPDDGAGDLG